MAVLTIFFTSSLLAISSLPSMWFHPSCPFSGKALDPSAFFT
jgi:hypothetical protein